MAINFFNNLQVNKGYIEIDDGGTTSQRGIISYGVNGKIGATTGWTPDTGSQPGLWVEGSNDGESGGIFMNGNTCALWSPGDQGILKIYDEDNFFGGPVYQITGSGISEGNRFASIFDNTYYLDPDGDSQLNTVDVDDYVRHRGDTNTYIGFPANDTFTVTTSSSERVRVTSNGNVGIGTDNPGGLLHVSSGTSGDAVVIIESDTDNSNENDNPHVELRQDGGGIRAKLGIEGLAGSTYSNSVTNATYLGTVFEQPLQFITGNTGGVQTAKMTIEPNSGNVGIRTVSPASALDVNGTIRVRNQLNVGETSEQNLFVQGGTGAQYVKMGAYGGANFQGLQSSENIPRTTTAFGANGKIVEATRIYTTKILASGFPTTNGFTGGVDITPTPGSASIIYIRNILVHRPPNSTQGSYWGTDPSPIYFAIKGQNNTITSSEVIARIPRDIVISGTQNVYTYMPPIIGTLNSNDQYSSNLEEHTAPGSALKICLSGVPASFSPPSALFVSVEYSMINLINFRNNPDQTLS